MTKIKESYNVTKQSQIISASFSPFESHPLHTSDWPSILVTIKTLKLISWPLILGMLSYYFKPASVLLLGCNPNSCGHTNLFLYNFLCPRTTRTSDKHVHSGVPCLGKSESVIPHPASSFGSSIKTYSSLCGESWVLSLTVLWTKACNILPATCQGWSHKQLPWHFQPLDVRS